MRTKEQIREKLVLEEMGKCEHFNGIQNAVCSAGINIRQLVGGDDFGWARRIPCLLDDAPHCEVQCDKRSLNTRQEAEALIAKYEAKQQRTMQAVRAAHEHAKRQGLGSGNGGKGALPCPLDCGGQLHYSVSSVNGHMWGKCDNGCVAWME